MLSPDQVPECVFALEEYMLLQEQHEELSTHLQQIRPRQSSVSSISTRSSSSSSSYSPPSPNLPSRTSGRHHTRPRARCSGWRKPVCGPVALDTIIDEETLHEISAEEQRLFALNESIKRALTELLNTDTVRGDNSMRMWAQARLMETEKELRSGRRRRGCPGAEW
ncbi:hypothetical protein HRG_010816 [Hirsutella rhossiliensis]|uniref:Uncharacterized protein n=1 Tax=Hirsutella rhossiliensis TaxID=111463 RepID=A0A9P8MQ35_9HYPO|nr:uncharacterized protein HRG_10816 [Hirsutella rhossiliensis]KAH0958121.1 hypothetical protein HRG_10816 [Hirsutella rhossiliensis]